MTKVLPSDVEILDFTWLESGEYEVDSNTVVCKTLIRYLSHHPDRRVGLYEIAMVVEDSKVRGNTVFPSTNPWQDRNSS